MSINVTRARLLLATSALAVAAMSVPHPAKADSLGELRVELNIIQSQIRAMQAQSKHFTPAKRDELAQIKAEVAQLKAQLDQAQLAAAAPAPAPMPVSAAPAAAPAPRGTPTYEQQLAVLPATPNNQGVSFNGGTSPLGPKVQKPIVGGIPLITTPGGAFFIAGTLDAGIRDDIGAGHSVVAVQSGLMRASRLTLEGYQAVPFGLRVVGVIEGGLNVATGTGADNPGAAGSSNDFDFGRESFVGIGNDDYGYIDFGRQYSPIWAVSAAPTADPFAGNYLGGIVAFDPTLAVNSRVSNAITYNYRYTWEGMLDPSPSRGFGFAAMYALGGGHGTDVAGVNNPTNAGQQFGASASYGTKHWWIGAGYHQIDGYNSNVAPFSNNYIPTMAGVPAYFQKTRLVEETISGSYLTPVARLFAQYNSQDDGRKDANMNGVDQNDWFVGFVAPTFPHQNLRFTYGQFYDHTNTEAEYSMYQASYEYDLVRVPGTALYVEGLVVDNNKHSAQGVLGADNVITTPGPGTILPDQLTANGSTPDYGATSTSLAMGIRFIF
jgi:predicted porin